MVFPRLTSEVVLWRPHTCAHVPTHAHWLILKHTHAYLKQFLTGYYGGDNKITVPGKMFGHALNWLFTKPWASRKAGSVWEEIFMKKEFTSICISKQHMKIRAFITAVTLSLLLGYRQETLHWEKTLKIWHQPKKRRSKVVRNWESYVHRRVTLACCEHSHQSFLEEASSLCPGSPNSIPSNSIEK